MSWRGAAVVSFWAQIFGQSKKPTREEVDAVLAREVSEATRQKLERAIAHREREVRGLVSGVIPKRGAEQ